MPYRSARHRMAQSDTWLLELFCGLYTLVWGVNFANPVTNVFATSPRGYSLLALFPGGETPFGLLVLALGAAMLIAGLYGRRRWRAWTLMIGSLFWLVVTVAVGVPTDWAAGGVSHFALVTVTHWFLWARLRYAGWNHD